MYKRQQYGYTGTISTSWRSQNEGGDKLAHAVATQLLVWETVVGERDADFNKVGTGGKSAICDQISTGHPLYSQIMSYYNSIAASVQTHSKVPSFFAKSTGKAKNIDVYKRQRNNTPTVSNGAKMIAYGDPNLQDIITGVENVDTMTVYINVETPTGTVALKKTSEDGVVAGISFTIKGDGFNKTVKTNKDGNIGP